MMMPTGFKHLNVNVINRTSIYRWMAIALMGVAFGTGSIEIGVGQKSFAQTTASEQNQSDGALLDAIAHIQQLASLLYESERYAEAIVVAEEAVELSKQLLDPTHISVAEVLNILGLSYQTLGRYAEAELLYEQALSIFISIHGANNLNVATLWNNLAGTHLGQGNYADAEQLFLRSLSLKKSVLGESHPDVAISLSNLAGVYEATGNYVDAERLYQEALAMLEMTLEPNHLFIATGLSNLARIYQTQSKYAESEPLYERSLSIFEANLGATSPSLANGLSGLAGIYQSLGKYTEAEELYERSLSILEPLEGHDLTIAQILSNLATLYVEQARYSDAEPHFQRALSISQNILGERHPDVAFPLNNWATSYMRQGRYDEAEELLEQAIAINEAVFDRDHPTVVQISINLAELYHLRGDYMEAESILQRSLSIYRDIFGENDPNVALVLNNLAGLYKTQGYYSRAESLLEQSIEIIKSTVGEEHPSVAQGLNNLAEIYRLQGNYVEAEPLYQKSIDISINAFEENHPIVAKLLNNLGLTYQNQGNYIDAIRLYQQAISIYEMILGEFHPDLAQSLNNLAHLYHIQGNHADAESLLIRSRDIYIEAFGENHPDVAQSINNLSEVYLSQENYTEAESAFGQSLAIFKSILGNEHPYVAFSLHNLARLYQEKGDYITAESFYKQSISLAKSSVGNTHPHVSLGLQNLAFLYQSQENIPLAVQTLKEGLAVEEKNLALTLSVGSERRKQAYSQSISTAVDAAISLHLDSAPTNPDAANLALTTVLRRKGRVLDAVTGSFQRLRQNLSATDRSLLDDYKLIQSQLATLLYSGLGNQDSSVYRTQIDELRKESDRLENELAQRSAEFRVEAKPVEIEVIQTLIPSNATLVEFVKYRPFDPTAPKSEQWGEPQYAAYTLNAAGERQWADLGDAAVIDQTVTKFLQSLQAASGSFKQSARELDALMMEPVRELVGETEHLLIAPDGQLNLIPFAALIDEHNQYLVETYQITTLTTGRDLLKLQLDQASQQDPVILANPDFDTPGNPNPASIPIAQSQTTSLEVSESRALDRRSTDLSNLKFGPLPGTDREANAITPLLTNATLLSGTNATENVLKQLQAPSILHIATHGFFLEDVPFVALPTLSSLIPFENDGNRGLGLDYFPLPNSAVRQDSRPINNENPLLRSGLALAGFNSRESGEEDGVLTALEASSLNLSGTELVVLSACETAVGDVANGEGVYGLRRAFAIAGAEGLMMSLWQVSDRGTADLMTRYYRRLKAGEGRSEALRSTQLDLMNTPGYEHPYYWASFIFSGDWTPLESL